MSVARFDRGELARPVSVGAVHTFEGRAARVHGPGDALEYGTTREHRDASELQSIARQIAAGVPITVGHPSSMPASRDPHVRVVGRTVGARIDDGHAIAIMRIDDRRGVELIGAGVRELSLGYATDLVERAGALWQTAIRIDHLALVERARCGATCAVRVDSNHSPQKAPVHMCMKSKFDSLNRETRARLDSAADAATAWIADANQRALERQRHIDRELARMERS